MGKVVTLVSVLVLVWTWTLQGMTAEERDGPDESDETPAFDRQMICNQPPKVGPCKAFYQRYYYDPNSMTCKIFIYGGCGGNQNNFENNAKCTQTCRPEEVCVQPPQPGQCAGYFERYFYNSTSMNCERFIYGGCGGNQNNFEMREKCLQSCYRRAEGDETVHKTRTSKKAEVCVLPPEAGPCKAYIKRFFYNSTSMNCDVFVYGGCDGNQNRFKNKAQCMKSCQVAGARSAPEPAFNNTEVCSQPPETGPCKMHVDRYFYNSTSMSCSQFFYGGCDGNQNNFKSKAKCMYTCQREDVCNQPPQSGQCAGYFEKYFYNSTSRSCEVFIYGGCGGNQNNFGSKKACKRSCHPEDEDSSHESPEFNKAEVCNLPSETGPCKAHMERYFYNPTSGSCETFVYGGCGGNENNFGDQAQCMKACHAADKSSHEEVSKAEVCNQPPEKGPCKAAFRHYFYDSNSMSCKPFIYGGCQGNQNNFKTIRQCVQTCQHAEVCVQAPQRGRCSGFFEKYFYNSTSMNCESFVYGGCDGNQNNFESKEECMKSCHS